MTDPVDPFAPTEPPPVDPTGPTIPPDDPIYGPYTGDPQAPYNPEIPGPPRVPSDLGPEAAEGAEAVETAAEGAEVVAEGAEVAETGMGLAEGLTAFGEGILAVEAAGGAEAELATGPPGWVVGAAALAVAGAAIGAGYLLSDDDDPSTQPGAGDLAPDAQPVEDQSYDPSGYEASGYDESAMG